MNLPQPSIRCFALALLLASGAVQAADAPDPLYQRLGGEVRVARFVDLTIDRTAADPRLNASFDKVDLARVKQLIVEQICSLTGGGCTYSGDSMKDVHDGLGITEAHLYGLVEHLRTAMIETGVPLRERNELLAVLAPMKRDVVAR